MLPEEKRMVSPCQELPLMYSIGPFRKSSKMTSNATHSLSNSKSTISVPQAPSQSQFQSGPILGVDNNAQRRSGSGGLGAASASRASTSTARNNQSFRKQHKGQRRYRLVDDDAAAESVSFTVLIFTTLAAVCWHTMSEQLLIHL